MKACTRACAMLLLVVAACGGDAPVPIADEEASPAGAAPSAAVRRQAPSGWDDAAGPVLLVPGEQPGEVLVVFPEVQGDALTDTLASDAYEGSDATLVSRAGMVGTTALAAAPEPAEGESCRPWPTLAAGSAPGAWTMGFVAPNVTVVALDSVQALPAADSTRLVSEVARLVSALPHERTAEGAAQFEGLPFSVHDARWFTDDSVRVLFAHAVRRVNQEASPLEEHTLALAERPESGGAWRVGYTERVVGREETVTRTELLGALRLRGAPALVVARDGADGVHYALLRRSRDGTWRIGWRSARPRC